MRSVTIGIGLGILGLGFAVPATRQDPKKDWPKYSTDVAPVFKASCLSCHAGKEPAADLDLSKPEEWVKSDIIKVGDPEHSVLIRRMKGLDGLPSMPQGFKPLPPEKIKAIEDWIKYGAKVDKGSGKHWAYIAPVMPALPTNKLKWGHNAVDAFTLEKMTEQKLKPSPEASKETLVRRLYLDLVGLPPTVAEVDAYLADKSPNAYEKLVDKLLASKHFGERQARIWLDVARYSDTNGYEKDRIRTAWLYRDWVINAFNANMPYDKFTIEQLAGDMLPNATTQDKIATGFHRNSMFNEEGGVDPGETFYNTVIDRVTTTSTAWLGSTLQCSRCHDHKFDPFTQKDFYQMYAIFSNVSYRKDGDYKKSDYEHWIEPELKVYSADAQKKLDATQANISSLEQQKAQFLVSHAEDYSKWQSQVGKPVTFAPAKVDSFKSEGGATATTGDVIEVGGPNADTDEYAIQIDLPKDGISGLRIETLPAQGKPQGRASSQNFVLTEVGLTVDGQKVGIIGARADFAQSGYDPNKLLVGDRESGWAVAPQYGQGHRLVLQIEKPVTGQKATLKLGFHSQWKNHNLGRFRISTTSATYPLLDVTSVDTKNLSSAYFASSPVAITLQSKIDAAQRTIDEIQAQAPTALVMQEKPVKGKIMAPIHHRGEYLSPTDMVEAGTPAIFPKPTTTVNMNRLEFAKWLVNGQNPLTARVEVNRIWEQYFGRGIVDTLDDFGTQSSPPSNQKLLDFLAVKFMQSKWDMKAIHKMIVMSATYRQSSVATKDALEKDPINMFVARGPRFRMEAEMIRDSALQISGLLNPEIGGPSVMPYQPAGIWDSPYNGEQWMEAKDKERYRRGIYVFAKRTAMYPSFATFDAGTRETCIVQRSRTNTPLQALTLLNDQAYLEAAKALGVKMEQRGSLEQGLVYGFRAATGRKPTRDELTVLAKAFGKFKDQYTKDPGAAKKLGKDVRQAAWTMVGNVLLNLDETITKE